MRFPVSLKLVVIPIVVLSTWSVTRSIRVMAQLPRPRAAHLTKYSIGKDPVAQIPGDVVVATPWFHPKSIASARVEQFSLSQEGGAVVIHASFNLMRRRPGPFHLLRLRVRDLSGNQPMSDVPYFGQRFQIPPSGKLFQPTFDESLNLAPGKYRVQLHLYKIPDNFEMKDMPHDEETESDYTILSVSRDIQVK